MLKSIDQIMQWNVIHEYLNNANCLNLACMFSESSKCFIVLNYTWNGNEQNFELVYHIF